MVFARNIRAGWVLGSGYAVEHFLLILRTVIIARILGPEHFGISLTFLLIVSAFNLITDVGIEKFVVQVKDNEIEEFLPTLSSILLVRGITTAVAIFVLSDWIAASFGNPSLGWFYALAATIPLIDGFRHLDPLVQQRHMRFDAYIKVHLGGLIIGILVTVLLAAYGWNYLAMAVGCITTSIVSVLLSHVLSSDRYRLNIDISAAKAIMRFGWPLLLNGVVIFIAMQGDRILIGTLRGMEDLAGYAVVAAITGAAAIFFARLFGNLSLPLLSEARNDILIYGRICGDSNIFSLMFVSFTLFPFALLGAPLVRFIFGPNYEIAPLTVAFLAITGAATILRSWAVCISLSLAGTSDILTTNLLRLLGLIGAAVALSQGLGVEWVAACMCGGDILATLLSLFQASRRTKAALGPARFSGAIFTTLVTIVILLHTLADINDGWMPPSIVAILCATIGASAYLRLSSNTRYRFKAMIVDARGVVEKWRK